MLKKLLPYISVKSVDDYFNLPKKQRTKFGLYLIPNSLPLELFSQGPGWESWRKNIRKEFPVQGWVREWFFSHDNPMYSSFKINLIKLDLFVYSIKRFFNPLAPRMRQAWKRHEYKSISDAIIDINHALILDFWYSKIDTIENYNLDLNKEEIHFYNWIKQAVLWIEQGKLIADQNYMKELKNANKSHHKEYNKKYKIVDDILNEIEQKDEEILKKMIFYRKHFNA